MVLVVSATPVFRAGQGCHRVSETVRVVRLSLLCRNQPIQSPKAISMERITLPVARVLAGAPSVTDDDRDQRRGQDQDDARRHARADST